MFAVLGRVTVAALKVVGGVGVAESVNGFRTDALPQWAVTVLRLGAVTLIALYLVRAITDIATGDLAEIRDKMNSHVAAMTQLQLEFETFRADQADFMVTMLALEQRICLNTANDGPERQACLNPEPKPIHHPGGGE
jgi:hypothetical protein